MTTVSSLTLTASGVFRKVCQSSLYKNIIAQNML